MKNFGKAALLAAFVFMVTACGGAHMISLEPEANQMWNGKTHASIIKEYGAPNREMSDGMDGKILVYEHTETTVTTTAEPNGFGGGIYEFYYGFNPMRNTTLRTETTVNTEFVNFYIDGKGICYKVETNLQRPETESEKNERKASGK